MSKVVVKKSNKEYKNLLNKISNTFESGRDTAIQSVNSALVETYWQVGRHIVEFKQKGKNKAVYGENLLRALAKDLSAKLGKGFSMPNLYCMRLFYQRFPIFQTLSGKLSWSHYVEIISIDNELERNFYYNQSIFLTSFLIIKKKTF